MKTIRYAAWGTAALLVLVHAAVVMIHTALVIQQDAAPGGAAVGYWMLVILTAAILAAGLKKRRIAASNTYLLLIAALILLLGAGTAWLASDTPAVADDYSAKDVACPANESFAYLAAFNAGDVQVPEITGPEDHQDIEAAWDVIREWRNAIDALDRFDRICDLPESVAFTADIPLINFTSLRSAADIHGHYFLAGVSAGQAREAAEAFCRLHRVARKGLDNATLLIHKMIFAHLVDTTIDISWAALQNENMDRQTLIILQENFLPIECDEISLVRPLISEYLILKNTMRGLMPGRLMDSAPPVSGKPADAQSLNPLLSRVVSSLGFKLNRSLADMKTYYDVLIDAHRRHPVDVTHAGAYMDAYVGTPPIRNMAGWMLNSIAMPDLTPSIERLAAIKIKSDLLALSLNRRLRRTVTLTDYYTGRELRYRTQSGLLRHPGRDGVFDTPDDVVLRAKR